MSWFYFDSHLTGGNTRALWQICAVWCHGSTCPTPYTMLSALGARSIWTMSIGFHIPWPAVEFSQWGASSREQRRWRECGQGCVTLASSLQSGQACLCSQPEDTGGRFSFWAAVTSLCPRYLCPKVVTAPPLPALSPCTNPGRPHTRPAWMNPFGSRHPHPPQAKNANLGVPSVSYWNLDWYRPDES